MQKLWTEVKETLDSAKPGIIATTLEGVNAGAMGFYGQNGLKAGVDVLENEKTDVTTGIIKTDYNIYVEEIIPRPALTIFGGGHVAVPTAKLGTLLDFDVYVNDDRKDFANPERFPQAQRVLAMSHEQAFGELDINSRHYVVIVTRGHVHDRDCLARALKTDAAYIGMIGSKKKAIEVEEWLRQEGFSQRDIDRVFAPIGLPINAETPEEIAVSIMAEVVRERSKRPAPANLGEIAQALINKPQSETWGLVTIIEAGGSTPRGVGARMLVKPGGQIIGTVGGGPGEKQAEEIALEVMQTKIPQVKDFKLNSTIAAGQGMVCGGNFTMFIQPV